MKTRELLRFKCKDCIYFHKYVIINNIVKKQENCKRNYLNPNSSICNKFKRDES